MGWRGRILCAAVVMDVLAAVVTAEAATTRYVSPTGADSGTCAATPCRSIQYAVDRADAGDEILVAAGTYTAANSYGSSRQVVYLDKRLTLRGGYPVGSWTSSNPTANPTIIDAGYTWTIATTAGSFQAGEIVTGGTSGATATAAGIDGTRFRLTGATKSFQVGETITGGTSGATGRVGRAVSLTVTSGAFQAGDTITGGTSGATATVAEATPGRLSVVPVSGNLAAGETVTGGTSGATGTIVNVALTFKARGITVQNAQAVTLDGFRVVNGDGTSQGAQNYGAGDTVGCGPKTGWMLAGKGGGICAKLTTLTILNSIIENNTATTLGNEHGHGGGVYSDETTLRLVNTLVRGNQGNPSWWGHGAGLFVAYGAVDISESEIVDNLAGNPGEGGALQTMGSTGSMVNSTVSGNRPSGGTWTDTTMVVIGGAQPFTLTDNRIVDNQGVGVSWGGTTQYKSPVTMRRNLVARNERGISVGAYGTGAVENNVLLANGRAGADGGAIYVHTSLNVSDPPLTFKHNTLSNTVGNSAVYMWSGIADFWNTIIAGSTVGVHIAGSNVRRATFRHTLFDANGTDIQGSPTQDIGHLNGSPAFGPDGYHLTSGSSAIDAGLDAGVPDDIDGAIPKRPQGHGPDIGADESSFSRPYTGSTLELVKTASKPRLLTWLAPGESVPHHRVDQEFAISLANPSSAPAVSTFTLTDTFPAALDFSGTSQSGGMLFSANGKQLTWQSTQPLPPGGTAWARIVGTAGAEDTRQTVVNDVTGTYLLADATPGTLSSSASSQIPNFPPLVTTPLTGEYCLNDANKMEVRGVSMPNAAIRVYQNGTEKARVTSDGAGKWTAAYDPGAMTAKPRTTVTITAKDCTGGTCSDPSNAETVYLPDYPLCAQRSYWEGTVDGKLHRFGFQNSEGRRTMRDFVMPGLYGFYNTTLRLYTCGCPDGATLELTVVADDVAYTPTISGRWYEYHIGGAHDVVISGSCRSSSEEEDPPGIRVTGHILIDPDGFVYDSTKGFDPDHPSDHALVGATVTCYVYQASLGGWVTWPAHMYNDQVNPQTTGASGYFSFFTPAGLYYLAVEPPAGFQPWRSPVIEVVSTPVRANVPLTPTIAGSPPRVTLMPSGMDQTTLNVPFGGTVEWLAALDPNAPASDVLRYAQDPVAQAKVSTRNATSIDATQPAGFDSGMLAPGQTFRRQFTEPGTYTFTDGSGHTGTIVVAAAPPPTVATVYPARGTTLGGAPVTISGTGFMPGATVTFGGVPALEVTVDDATSITAVIPAHVAEVVDVVVTNVDAQHATLASGFAFVAGIPTFTDDPVRARTTPIKAVHLTELRQRVDELRVRHGLGAAAWTDAPIVSGTTVIKAVHLTELRAAVVAVYVAISQVPPTWATPVIAAHTTVIGARQIAELRAAIVAIW